MSLGTILIIGAVLLAVAWVLQNPHVIGDLFKGAKEVRAEVEKIQTQVQAPARPVSDTSTIDVQFLDLRVGEIVSFDETGSASVTALEHTIKCVGTLQAQYRSGSNFTPQGDTYPYYETDDDLVFMLRPDGWVVLTKQTVMPGESIKQFDVVGNLFGSAQYQQRPGSVSLDWDGKKWAIQDEGYVIYQRKVGSGHLPDGVMVKYIIATDGSTAFYMEHVKTGTNSVWTGTMIGKTLDGYITKVLRASA